jgi:hypothetical protein
MKLFSAVILYADMQSSGVGPANILKNEIKSVIAMVQFYFIY